MKTSIFAAAASLFLAAFVAATPAPMSELDTTPHTLEPRCTECDEACPKQYFYYKPKKSCLQNGGPKNPPNPPQGRDCPKLWYWNDKKTSCTPRYPQQSNNPKPTCGTTTYPWWDKDNHCCTKPPTGSNPPPPQNSRRATPDTRQPKSKYTARKTQLKSRQDELCPGRMVGCPLTGAEGGFECIDPLEDISACGGCPALRRGQDCQRIPNSLNVACKASGKTASCVVNSCQDGFKPSSDGKSCVAA